MSLYQSGYRGTWLATALFDTFVRLYLRPKIHGRANLPASGPFILAANHASHADTAAIYAALPRRLRSSVVAAAAQDYFFENRIRRASARMLFNAVPVDRRPVAGRDPLRHSIRALREGYGLLIYPEGTRSPDGSIGTFRGGIGRLVALFPGVPVIPIWLDTARAMPKGAVAPQPRAVEIRFGAQLLLAAAPDDRASWQAAADAVREAVIQLRDQAASAAATQPGENAQIPAEGNQPPRRRLTWHFPRVALPAWLGRRDRPGGANAAEHGAHDEPPANYASGDGSVPKRRRSLPGREILRQWMRRRGRPGGA
jgi:1-acyl-sn-glycerol-3-phosphate acyltransferase